MTLTWFCPLESPTCPTLFEVWLAWPLTWPVFEIFSVVLAGRRLDPLVVGRGRSRAKPSSTIWWRQTPDRLRRPRPTRLGCVHKEPKLLSDVYCGANFARPGGFPLLGSPREDVGGWENKELWSTSRPQWLFGKFAWLHRWWAVSMTSTEICRIRMHTLVRNHSSDRNVEKMWMWTY